MINESASQQANKAEQSELLIRVDRFGREDGAIEKLKAHEKGILHRAVSVCIFDDKGRWLLQKRSSHKYHSAGLLANTCCGHPRPNETILEAAQRRLKEELGIETPLQFCSSFVYKTKVTDGLSEHEYDHVFIGVYNGSIQLNPNEVESISFMEEKEIEKKLVTEPYLFAAWFPFVFREVVLHKIRH